MTSNYQSQPSRLFWVQSSFTFSYSLILKDYLQLFQIVNYINLSQKDWLKKVTPFLIYLGLQLPLTSVIPLFFEDNFVSCFSLFKKQMEARVKTQHSLTFTGIAALNNDLSISPYSIWDLGPALFRMFSLAPHHTASGCQLTCLGPSDLWWHQVPTSFIHYWTACFLLHSFLHLNSKAP